MYQIKNKQNIKQSSDDFERYVIIIININYNNDNNNNNINNNNNNNNNDNNNNSYNNNNSINCYFIFPFFFFWICSFFTDNETLKFSILKFTLYSCIFYDKQIFWDLASWSYNELFIKINDNINFLFKNPILKILGFSKKN